MATITGTGGNDTLNGDQNFSGENDSIIAGGGADLVDGLGGNDTILGETGNDTLYGGTGDDSIFGGDGTDQLFGGDGNDTLFGGAGNDTLDGGAGFDYVSYAGLASNRPLTVNLSLATPTASSTGSGSEGLDTLVGIEGIIGGAGADTMTGDGNANHFIGGGGNDRLFGGDGNDTLSGGAGNDSLAGGGGIDTADFSDATSNLNITLNTTLNGSASGQGNDTLNSIENVIGGSGNDTINGDSVANFLSGLAGNDRLFGGGGDDTLAGGTGNDSIDGGAGIDTADFSSATSAVNVDLVGGSASGQGTDTLVSIENVIGGGGNDTITGDSVANVLSGGGGNDVISAGGGADTVFGGMGNDTIDGGDGDDVLTGGPDSVESAGTPLDFNWITAATPDNTDLSGGFTQDTGGISVQVSFTPGAGGLFRAENDNPLYVEPGEPFATNSAGYLSRPGAGAASEVNFEFSAVPGSGFGAEVENVQFRISDIDRSGWTDRIIIRAYDADGNPVEVSFIEYSSEISVNGDSIIATGNDTSSDQFDGSVLIQIAGPVARIEIVYDNLGTAGQIITVSDIHFEAISIIDDDSILGGLGNDTIYGGIGSDTLIGGADNDQLYGGVGNDSLEGGAGNDLLEGGDGDDRLLFGEGDDTVYGGAGNDVIDDVDGSQLDGVNLLYGGTGNDTIWAGNGDDTIYGDEGDDVINGEAGNDLIYGGAGADTLSGGDGNDTFVIATADIDTLIGGGPVESIFGGGGPDSAPGDFDTLDLSDLYATYGWSRIVITATDDEDGIITILDGPGGSVIGTIVFDNIEEIIRCFTPGTMILTDRGDVAVEDLVAGDLVMTRDHGLQPIRWVGRQHLSHAQLVLKPEMQPVEISAGAFGLAEPRQTMLVSPQHRILVENVRAELLFGEAEVLVPAKHLIGDADVRRLLPEAGVTYIHLLFDRHEIVLSDGIWTESFQPAEPMLNAMEAEVRAEILSLFPELEADTSDFVGARLSLKAHEARVLFAAE